MTVRGSPDRRRCSGRRAGGPSCAAGSERRSSRSRSASAGAISGPALTAAAATPSTTTVHGDVHLGSAALGGYRVGFFDPDGRLRDRRPPPPPTARSRCRCRRTSPGTPSPDTDPTAQRAISDYRGRKFVRGVVGLHQPIEGRRRDLPEPHPGPAPPARRRRHDPPAPAALRGASTAPGTCPKGSEVTVQRLNGSSVGASGADAHGSFRTPALVPGGGTASSSAAGASCSRGRRSSPSSPTRTALTFRSPPDRRAGCCRGR